MSKMGSHAGGRRTRRRFSEEFKEGAVRLVLDENKTVGEVARELDLTASALGLWVKLRSFSVCIGDSILVSCDSCFSR